MLFASSPQSPRLPVPFPAMKSPGLAAVLGPAAWALACGAISGCGDNSEPQLDGPPLVPARSMVVIAHFDDDMVFMQPELIEAIEARSLTTVYVTSGDPIYGIERAERNLKIAQIAYSSIAHSADWDCGYVLVGNAPVHHCKLPGRGISMIGLDVPDGGVEGADYDVGPLNLVEGGTPDVPLLGAVHGNATVDSIIDTLAAVLTETQPAEIHALDLAATHDRDHPSHLFSSSFALWAAARVGYRGPIQWHRGYNVKDENLPITLDGADAARARVMLGYYDACYFGCGPCGSSCPVLTEAHEGWMVRQYSYERAPLEAMAPLALEADDTSGPELCVSPGDPVVVADCSAAPPVKLDANGHIRLGDACLASRPGAADPVMLAPCADDPAQYWVADSEGHVWNGVPPVPSMDMLYNHVRCLSADARPGAIVSAPTCGSRLHPTWRLPLTAR
jgi:hypothetical protein